MVAAHDDHDPVGWTEDPEGRGTWSLIFACLTTTFLCTWIVIHPRVDARQTTRVLHKVALSIKTVIAPELIAVEGAQEWAQAQRIIRQCAKYTNGEFKLVHAFYLGMFGIRYRVSDFSEDRAFTKILWPTQYVWLLEQGLVSWEDREAWGLCEDTINDKSNSDWIAKVLAIFGVGQFTVQSVIRISKGLPLAPLESMTLGYIPQFGLAYIFWWLKPKDIEMPTIVQLPTMSADQRKTFDSLAYTDVFDNEGKPEQASLKNIWRLTPRDFEIELFEERQAREKGRYGEGTILSHWDPDLYRSRLWPVAMFFAVSFGALHLVSWNFNFPTSAELWLWRISAIVSMVGLLVFMQFEKVALRWRDPVTLVCLLSGALYMLSRVVAVAEAVLSFRAADAAIYQT